MSLAKLSTVFGLSSTNLKKDYFTDLFNTIFNANYTPHSMNTEDRQRKGNRHRDRKDRQKVSGLAQTTPKRQELFKAKKYRNHTKRRVQVQIYPLSNSDASMQGEIAKHKYRTYSQR
ncbi:hypothetical protein NQ315_003786 [Exocentrus adspersus]|uniref:Uncharacterized protein n=1 Tax=Exocentrus adspersus TaxID=1586481 RepID=A0AAV8V807_9CUCU|nr:hypothetical protein NQ315_003786 [Exocentrus adspersus]